jgi:2-dehydropantoate 2-reductase
MTFVIYGVGAIGGVVAARLALSGQPVVGIARGAQLDAIRSGGLKLRSPSGDRLARFTCLADPTEMEIGRDDMILLAMKSQDTAPALERLRAAGVGEQPIFCFQNGIANERMALRLFPNVHAVTVVMPATYVTAGEVSVFGAPNAGVFDIGRYPAGGSEAADALVRVLNVSGFAAFSMPDPMLSKNAKLIRNLGNVVDAAYGAAPDARPIAAAARREGEMVLKAAGMAHGPVGEDDPRRDKLMQLQPIPGAERVGSSTAQSLARGTGSIESDYLNGEIVLLGRLHGVPTPVNAWLMQLGHRLVAGRHPAGSMPVGEALGALSAWLR